MRVEWTAHRDGNSAVHVYAAHIILGLLDEIEHMKHRLWETDEQLEWLHDRAEKESA